MIISQKKFTLDLLHVFDSLHLSFLSSLLNPNVKLLANQGISIKDLTLYRLLLGKLNYLTYTIPDISFTMQHQSEYMQDTRELHLAAALRVLRYLFKDPGGCLFMCEQLANIFTKSLTGSVQHQFLGKLGVSSSPPT